MPIYEYRCSACQHDFEALVTSSSQAACPACGSTTLEKHVSLPAAPGKSQQVVRQARAQAAREGHLSNFSPSER